MDLTSLLPMFNNLISNFSNQQQVQNNSFNNQQQIQNNTYNNQQNFNNVSSLSLGYPDSLLTDTYTNQNPTGQIKNNQTQQLQNNNPINNNIQSFMQNANQISNNPLISSLLNLLSGKNGINVNALQSLSGILGSDDSKNNATDILNSFLHSTKKNETKEDKKQNTTSIINKIKKVADIDLNNLKN